MPALSLRSVAWPIRREQTRLVFQPDWLQALDEVERPIWIKKSVWQRDQGSGDGGSDLSEPFFQNRCSLQCLGKLRSAAGRRAYLQSSPSEQQQDLAMRAALMQEVFLKGKAHRALIGPERLESIFVMTKPNNVFTSLLVYGIQLQVSPDQDPERMLLFQIEGEVQPDSMRQAAMHHSSPIHSLMFARDGSLLCANRHALDRYQEDSRPITLQRIFDEGSYPGGAVEAQAACAEALDAIFVQKVGCHRHMQPRRSKKNNEKMRFTMCEIWPLDDPISSQPALQVCLYSITKQKEAELELHQAQEDLQRQMLELEQQKQQLEHDKAQIQEEKEQLAERLEAVVNSTLLPEARIDTDTPVDKTLKLLHRLIKGTKVPSSDMVDVYNLLSRAGTDLRAPVALERQLLEDTEMDSDVGAAMVALLKGSKPASQESISLSMMSAMAQQNARRSSASSAGEGCMLQDEEAIPLPLVPAVERMLAAAEVQWQFNPFALAELAPEACLSMLTFHFIKRAGLIQEFNLNEHKLGCYLRRIEMGYTSCPYHNRIHVLSVVQMMHMLLHHGGLLKAGVVDKMTLLGSYLAACVHDFEHQGLNNDFLVKTRDPLAVTYNDQSPLENHHLSASSRLLFRSQFAFLEAMPIKDQTRLRATVIEQVLATDMKRHFGIISRFQNSFQRLQHSQSPAVARQWDAVSADDKALAQQVALKCADIGHLAAAPAVHRRWALQLEEEFFLQGDQERRLGLPVSPLMDRNQKGGITRSQLGFFSIVGVPLFKAMVDIFEGAAPMLDGVMGNYRAWELAQLRELQPRD